MRSDRHEAECSYENPLYLAEEAAALDLIADGRVALGVSRGSPEPADRDWEYFGYTGSQDPRGADIARDEFDQFLRAVRGEPMTVAAVMSADTLMLTIPSQLGVDLNLHILENFAQHVAPALGWKPNTDGPVHGDTI